ncbi:MAG: helicase [Ignavibacteria bacterium]|nr:helicase [Ignavibacteria bacterium]
MKRLKFGDLNLSPEMLKAITDMGFEEATHIQSETLPHIFEGRDIIGQAQTGTGKTAAFAIPIIENLDESLTNIQAIVMCPTRELVIQVTEEFRKLMKYKDNIAVVPVYGGQEIDRQFRALKKNPQIIIGTPGRTIDHINRGTIKLNNIKFVVLDEADEMLDMGFRDDIEEILEGTPAAKQTIMFSATMPSDITRLMKKHQKNPMRIDVSMHKINTPKIEQYYFELQEKDKSEALARLLDLHNVKLALVFCNTKIKVDELVENLKSRGYFAEGLHGDMTQKQRDAVMNGFRTGSVEILCATDVAGRGIDVSDIEAVFNYDLPGDDEDYIHRIGRTGRAGKTGIAFTFVVGKQIYNLKRIEKTNDIKVKRQQIPTLEELDETRLKTIKNKIKKIIQEGHLKKYIHLVEKMMGEDYVALDIASALLKISIDQKNEGFDNSLKFDATPYFESFKDNKRKFDSKFKKGKSSNKWEEKSYSYGKSGSSDKKKSGNFKHRKGY